MARAEGQGLSTCHSRAGKNSVQLLTFSHFLPWHRHAAEGGRGERRPRERGREKLGKRARKQTDRNQDKICYGHWMLNQGDVIWKYSPTLPQGLGCFHLRERAAFWKAKNISKKLATTFFTQRQVWEIRIVMGGIFYGNKIFILVSLMRISRQKIVSGGNHACERYF